MWTLFFRFGPQHLQLKTHRWKMVGKTLSCGFGEPESQSCYSIKGSFLCSRSQLEECRAGQGGVRRQGGKAVGNYKGKNRHKRGGIC